MRGFLVFSLIMTLAVSLFTFNGNVYSQEEALSVFPFKGVYSVGMTVTLVGNVSTNFTPGETVSVRVTNPTGQTYQTANAALDEGGSYTFQFRLEGAQASVLGIHRVEATYRTFTAETTFEVKARPTLTIETDQSIYNLGDIVTISGQVSPRLIEPLQLRIYGFNNTVWKFVPVSAEDIFEDGTFEVEVGELLGKNVKPATYRVEASYADGLAAATLQFDVRATGKAVVGNLRLVDPTGARLNDIFVGQQVLVQADVKNILDERQQFAYLVLIKDINGFTVSLSWITGTLPPDEMLSAAQSWVPNEAGSFSVEVFLWENVANPVPLTTRVPTTTITVTE